MKSTKYIHLRELENEECPSIGVVRVGGGNTARRVRLAIEQFFDAAVVSITFKRNDVTSFEDCLSAYPIDAKVVLDEDDRTYIVEASETWLY